jgi:hypothetical protein
MCKTHACHPHHHERDMDCDVGWLPVLAFLPAQKLNQVFEPECGFSKGTIFPELDKPFMAGGCGR